MKWKKRSDDEIKSCVFNALSQNINYKVENVIGLPGSHLDERVFSQEVGFIHDAPYLSTLVQNPNHIGCHTIGDSESYFTGTHELEREVIAICAEDILKAKPNSVDGYVSAGGTEANLQAVWIYRNYFMREKGAKLNEIALICSSDSHYSMAKAANMFQLNYCSIPVDFNTRHIELHELDAQLNQLKQVGVKYLVVVANMMTTMFGSVDDLEPMVDLFQEYDLEVKIHIDGAYGGFYFPFSNEHSTLNFENEWIDSFTLDAHKMVQAPYGTGIFLIRKGWMQYATTKEASYVLGEDCTISGSRSGANAVAIWMIFAKYGFHGWFEKILILQKRTDWLEKQLKAEGIRFYRNKYANIVTIEATDVPKGIADKFGLVPDNHDHPKWYKIVVMDHVTLEKLELFVEELYKVQA